MEQWEEEGRVRLRAQMERQQGRAIGSRQPGGKDRGSLPWPCPPAGSLPPIMPMSAAQIQQPPWLLLLGWGHAPAQHLWWAGRQAGREGGNRKDRKGRLSVGA